jgi:rubrerythrin
MPENHTIRELNELAIALERTAESVYRGLGVMFAHEPEVAEFWNFYASEEATHAQWLQELRDGQDEHRLRKQIDGILVEATRQVLQKSPEELFGNINNLEEAFQLAIGFEGSETNVIFNFLISDFKLAQQAKEFLRTQLNTHIERLDKEFPERFQTRATRLAILAKRPK